MVGVGAYCTKSSSSWKYKESVHFVANLKVRVLSRSVSCAYTCVHLLLHDRLRQM